MKKVLIAALLTASSFGTLAVVEASPASAACTSGYSCLWEDADYNTNGQANAYIAFSGYIPRFSEYYFQGTAWWAHDNVSSLKNNGNSQTARYYKDAYCSGSSFSLGIKKSDGNLNNSVGVPSGYNDSLSSGAYSGRIGDC